MSFKLYGELFADDGKIYDGKTCQATLLADCNPHGEFFESTSKANAEAIVKRCNMHDELVKALKLSRKFLTNENGSRLIILDFVNEVLTKAENS